MTLEERIEDELHTLGITPRYRGYRLTVKALVLALEDEDRLQKFHQQICRPVAELCGCKTENVIRDIGTAARIAWEWNPARLQEIARYPLKGRPSPLEFITMLYTHFKRAEETVKS